MSGSDEANLRHVRKLAVKLGGLLALAGVALAATLILVLVRLGAFHGATGGMAVLVAAAGAGVVLIVAVVAALNLRHAPRHPDPTTQGAASLTGVASHRRRRAWIILLAGIVALVAVLVFRLSHASAALLTPCVRIVAGCA